MNLSLVFTPKLRYDEIECYLRLLDEIQIENDEIYASLEELTNLAYPTYEDQYDKRWEYFYVPVKRGRKIIAIPIWIMRYNEDFFAIVQSFGNLHVKKGNRETERFYRNIFSETLKFVPIIKKYESVIQKIVPYDVRTGKIKGRYVLDELFLQSEKETILENYKIHITNNLKIEEISLNEYLNIVAICYNAAYKEKTKDLSPIDLYHKWADGRDGEMLLIKDWNSRKEFSDWYHSGKYVGSHPFEIVFSWHEHGIHLYPPNDLSSFYTIVVTNYAYARDFVEMVKTLIKMKIPFEARNLEVVLDFLVGDTYFTVNKHGEHDFSYIPSRKYKQKYFSYIEWDDIKTVKWKRI